MAPFLNPHPRLRRPGLHLTCHRQRAVRWYWHNHIHIVHSCGNYHHRYLQPQTISKQQNPPLINTRRGERGEGLPGGPSWSPVGWSGDTLTMHRQAQFSRRLTTYHHKNPPDSLLIILSASEGSHSLPEHTSQAIHPTSLLVILSVSEGSRLLPNGLHRPFSRFLPNQR